MNILQATMCAMHRAISQCELLPDHIAVDGNYFRTYVDFTGEPVNHTTIEGGDDKYYSIAAASILAKYTRDQYILNLCDHEPELDERYDLRKNKGYGAPRHLEGIKKYGISKYHRKTFGSCKCCSSGGC